MRSACAREICSHGLLIPQHPWKTTIFRLFEMLFGLIVSLQRSCPFTARISIGHRNRRQSKMMSTNKMYTVMCRYVCVCVVCGLGMWTHGFDFVGSDPFARNSSLNYAVHRTLYQSKKILDLRDANNDDDERSTGANDAIHDRVQHGMEQRMRVLRLRAVLNDDSGGVEKQCCRFTLFQLRSISRLFPAWISFNHEIYQFFWLSQNMPYDVISK